MPARSPPDGPSAARSVAGRAGWLRRGACEARGRDRRWHDLARRLRGGPPAAGDPAPPDLELKRLTPTNKDDYLFDDVLWVKRAKQEHDAFAEALRDLDVAVHLFDDLLRETVAIPEARKHVLDASFDERVYGPMATDTLYNTFSTMDDETLVTYLIGGMTKR